MTRSTLSPEGYTMTSPYLQLVPRSEADARKAILSRHSCAEASFPRTRRNDGTEWVSTKAPLRSWAFDISIGLAFIAVIIASMMLLSRIAEMCQSMNLCS